MAGALFLGSGLLSTGCDRKEEAAGPAPEASGDSEARDPVTGLTRAESDAVLARVGERVITLGEYATSLARMGEYERLRYQSKERQAELLEEMIQVELLAQEARRRGLDRDPEVELSIDRALRDELLEKIRRELPPLTSFSDRQVQDYYEAHRDTFEEPERRRVQVLLLRDAALAERLGTELSGASGEAWAQAARKHSLSRDGLGPGEAAELAGDLGFTPAPGERRGENPAVPEEVRAAVFQLKEVGQTAFARSGSPGRAFVVRYAGHSAARKRSLKDAERTIRVELSRRLFEERRNQLEAELRKKYPATVDEARLRSLPEVAPAPGKGAPLPTSGGPTREQGPGSPK